LPPRQMLHIGQWPEELALESECYL
jgi:hypothetical protein